MNFAEILGYKYLMKKILILSLFLSANIFAGYDAWVQSYSGGPWTKYGSYRDYGACERAIQYLWHPSKKCMPQ